LSRLGNKRAKELGLANCRFQEGDAANLHQVPEQASELFVSIFGAMFHCAQAVLRWAKGGAGDPVRRSDYWVAQILKISSAYTPPPPEDFVSPMTSGSRAT
jgi:hypothetical protein